MLVRRFSHPLCLRALPAAGLQRRWEFNFGAATPQAASAETAPAVQEDAADEPVPQNAQEAQELYYAAQEAKFDGAQPREADVLEGRPDAVFSPSVAALRGGVLRGAKWARVPSVEKLTVLRDVAARADAFFDDATPRPDGAAPPALGLGPVPPPEHYKPAAGGHYDVLEAALSIRCSQAEAAWAGLCVAQWCRTLVDCQEQQARKKKPEADTARDAYVLNAAVFPTRLLERAVDPYTKAHVVLADHGAQFLPDQAKTVKTLAFPASLGVPPVRRVVVAVAAVLTQLFVHGHAVRAVSDDGDVIRTLHCLLGHVADHYHALHIIPCGAAGCAVHEAAHETAPVAAPAAPTAPLEPDDGDVVAKEAPAPGPRDWAPHVEFTEADEAAAVAALQSPFVPPTALQCTVVLLAPPTAGEAGPWWAAVDGAAAWTPAATRGLCEYVARMQPQCVLFDKRWAGVVEFRRRYEALVGETAACRTFWSGHAALEETWGRHAHTHCCTVFASWAQRRRHCFRQNMRHGLLEQHVGAAGCEEQLRRGKGNSGAQVDAGYSSGPAPRSFRRRGKAVAEAARGTPAADAEPEVGAPRPMHVVGVNVDAREALYRYPHLPFLPGKVGNSLRYVRPARCLLRRPFAFGPAMRDPLVAPPPVTADAGAELKDTASTRRVVLQERAAAVARNPRSLALVPYLVGRVTGV